MISQFAKPIQENVTATKVSKIEIGEVIVPRMLLRSADER